VIVRGVNAVAHWFGSQVEAIELRPHQVTWHEREAAHVSHSSSSLHEPQSLAGSGGLGTVASSGDDGTAGTGSGGGDTFRVKVTIIADTYTQQARNASAFTGLVASAPTHRRCTGK